MDEPGSGPPFLDLRMSQDFYRFLFYLMFSGPDRTPGRRKPFQVFYNMDTSPPAEALQIGLSFRLGYRQHLWANTRFSALCSNAI